MRIDFQAIHTFSSQDMLLDKISETLVNTPNLDAYFDIEDEELINRIVDCINVNYHIKLDEEKNMSGFTTFLSFLNEDDEIERIGEFLEDFVTELKKIEGIIVINKFFDEYKKNINLYHYANEIFFIEMQLREIFSIIFLTEYHSTPYNLLNDYAVCVPKNNRFDDEYFKAHLENEFFTLLFSDYKCITLGSTKEIKSKDLLEIFKDSLDFKEVQEKLLKGIKNNNFITFLGNISDNLEAIESFRNCIMHNRSFSKKILENYEKAREELFGEELFSENLDLEDYDCDCTEGKIGDFWINLPVYIEEINNDEES